MLDTSIQVKLDQFDGPLSLLLLLVQREQMDIRELDLTRITYQYLDYLDHMSELDFDVAGEYLYLAATLTYLKSKECLSDEDQKELEEFKDELGKEADHLSFKSQSELIKRLELLNRYQKLSQRLWAMPQQGREVFTRPRLNKKYHLTTFLKKVDVTEMTGAMVDFLVREQRKFKVVKRDRLSIKEKLNYLKTVLKAGDSRTFGDLVEEQHDDSIQNVVINFIGLLELARLKRLEIYQNEDRGAIYLNVVKNLDDLDLEAANGFDDPEEEAKENVNG